MMHTNALELKGGNSPIPLKTLCNVTMNGVCTLATGSYFVGGMPEHHINGHDQLTTVAASYCSDLYMFQPSHMYDAIRVQ